MQFLAVALNASHAATAKAVRAHHWTIPVAYDEDGRSASVRRRACPMVELAYRGGIVVAPDRQPLGQRDAALEARTCWRCCRRGVSDEVELPAAGFVAPELRAEFPGLRLTGWRSTGAARRQPARGRATVARAV